MYKYECSMQQDKDSRKFERFFRSPRIGDDVIKPPMSGVACENIRIALRWLAIKLKMEISMMEN